MRKKTINHLADTIFWYLLYFLPVIAYIVYLATCGKFDNSTIQNLSFNTFLDSTGLATLITDNLIYTTLIDLFAVGGVLGFVEATSPIFIILTWFVNVFIMHLAVDFLLFIPRLCHKYMKKFTQGD